MARPIVRSIQTWRAVMLAVAFVCAAVPVTPTVAGDAEDAGATETARAPVALNGIDPVAFFREERAVPGDPAITAAHRGESYRFVSAANRNAFRTNPERYLPAFSGQCALAIAEGTVTPGTPRFGKVVDGRLYLLKNEKAYAVFEKDTQAIIRRAEQKWPALRQTSPVSADD